VEGSEVAVGDTAVERRAFARLPFSASVRYSVLGADADGTAQASDISRGGIRVMLVSNYGIGSRLRMAIAAPDGGEPIRVTGRVAWTQPITVCGLTTYDTGIEFLDLPDEDRERLVGLGVLLES